MQKLTSDTSLLLGPIVGHTDHESTTIWIRVGDKLQFIRNNQKVDRYKLRIIGVGDAVFLSTEEENRNEFGTAIAKIGGLRPNNQYSYLVLRNGRLIENGQGSFRTMPYPDSNTEIKFVAISCNNNKELGAWCSLFKYINLNKPYFLLMMGDQVYLDDDKSLDDLGDLWRDYPKDETPSVKRRKIMAARYQSNWSRHPIRQIMANIPTYMMWDDHEIRDGWGSFAPDSPTLGERFPKGTKIFRRYNVFFKDSREVFWHFQMSHNPYLEKLPHLSTERMAMPFYFRCGRSLILVIDSRGNRDLWRKEKPILGFKQWVFIKNILSKDFLDRKIETIVIVTPGPVVTMAHDSIGQKLLGSFDEDEKMFIRGDEKGIESLATQKKLIEEPSRQYFRASGGSGLTRLAKAIKKAIKESNSNSRKMINLMVGQVDDIRDQWSHKISRGEQRELIQIAGEAAIKNKTKRSSRKILFLGGDIHLGAIFDIELSNPDITIPCVVSSGINQIVSKYETVFVVSSGRFEVSAGINARLREVYSNHNFCQVKINNKGKTPSIQFSIIESGDNNEDFYNYDSSKIVRAIKNFL